jgi:hypothetical protein
MPTTPAHDTDAKRSPGRRALVYVALVFAVPMALALVLHVSGWRPEGRSLQHGELVQPARPLPDVVLHTAAGPARKLSDWRHRWLMVYAARLPCEAACESTLDLMRRVWLAQGREAQRVDLMFVVLAGTPAQSRELATTHPGLTVVGGTGESIQTLARALVSRDGTALEAPPRIYLVDPLGNLVLSYPPNADPSGIRKDLARLLRLSQVG